MSNLGSKEVLDLNTSLERYLSKLSENHKIVDIGSTVLKLWLFKDVHVSMHNLTVCLRSEINSKSINIFCQFAKMHSICCCRTRCGGLEPPSALWEPSSPPPVI